jgi:hypothetical protein
VKDGYGQQERGNEQAERFPERLHELTLAEGLIQSALSSEMSHKSSVNFE